MTRFPEVGRDGGRGGEGAAGQGAVVGGDSGGYGGVAGVDGDGVGGSFGVGVVGYHLGEGEVGG